LMGRRSRRLRPRCCLLHTKHQGWGPPGLASTLKIPRGQDFGGLGLEDAVLEHIPAKHVAASLT